MDYSPPGSSVPGIFQARMMEWVAISSTRGSSWPRDWTGVSWTAGGIFATVTPVAGSDHSSKDILMWSHRSLSVTHASDRGLPLSFKGLSVQLGNGAGEISYCGGEGYTEGFWKNLKKGASSWERVGVTGEGNATLLHIIHVSRLSHIILFNLPQGPVMWMFSPLFYSWES